MENIKLFFRTIAFIVVLILFRIARAILKHTKMCFVIAVEGPTEDGTVCFMYRKKAELLQCVHHRIEWLLEEIGWEDGDEK